MTDTQIPLGARVRLNDLGKTKTRMKSDCGTVVSRTKGNGFYVLMDGTTGHPVALIDGELTRASSLLAQINSSAAFCASGTTSWSYRRLRNEACAVISASRLLTSPCMVS